MLVGFVLIYLLITIGIGLYAAKRVHNSKDYLVAGRSLPLYINVATVFATWFGAETVLSVSATFAKDGLGGVVADPFGASFCLIFVALFFARRSTGMDLLTIGDFYRKRYSKRSKWSPALSITAVLPRLDLGADDRARAGVLRAVGRRDLEPARASLIGARDRADLHDVRRHVVGGADRPVPDRDHRRRPVAHRLAGRRHGGRRRPTVIAKRARRRASSSSGPRAASQQWLRVRRRVDDDGDRLDPAAGRVPARDRGARTRRPRCAGR